MKFKEDLEKVLSGNNIQTDLSRKNMIKNAVNNREVFISTNGALANITEPASTGRSPKDTFIVKRDSVAKEIDWDSPNNIDLEPEIFESILSDLIPILQEKEELYITNRVIGADSDYALPVKTITDKALTALFTDNMFRPVPNDIEKSVFFKRGFTLIALPYEKLDYKKYKTVSTKLRDTGIVVAMDFEKMIGIVIGSAYLGSVKKLMFTAMNYVLPGEGILPLHSSANENTKGESSLFLGLSGTGKTTLSADPTRALLGDDEHGWNENGIANFENGCYAKLIDLDPKKEPEIFNAIMHKNDYLDHGSIVENAMMYPNGKFDFYDSRITENSRGSYPLTYLSNIKESSTAGHPKTIIFLTADANGVLPPVSKLNENRAMLWFLMGYTSKLAGTETGIVDPVSTFSRFFGEPFMPRNPESYSKMLGEKIKKYGTKVFLLNTGWSGGPYGVGKRMDLKITRALLDSVLQTGLNDVEFIEDEIFHLEVPLNCEEYGPEILIPENSWSDKNAYKKRALQLANDFSNHFDKVYGNKNIDPDVVKCCPGK